MYFYLILFYIFIKFISSQLFMHSVQQLKLLSYYPLVLYSIQIPAVYLSNRMECSNVWLVSPIDALSALQSYCFTIKTPQ